METKAADLIQNVLKARYVKPPKEDEQFNYILCSALLVLGYLDFPPNIESWGVLNIGLLRRAKDSHCLVCGTVSILD